MKKFFSKLISHISSLFKNGGEHWSSTRFAFLLAVVLSNFVIFGVWMGLSIVSKTILPVDNSVIILYAICNGLLSATKLIQKPMENKEKHE